MKVPWAKQNSNSATGSIDARVREIVVIDRPAVRIFFCVRASIDPVAETEFCFARGIFILRDIDLKLCTVFAHYPSFLIVHTTFDRISKILFEFIPRWGLNVFKYKFPKIVWVYPRLNLKTLGRFQYFEILNTQKMRFGAESVNMSLNQKRPRTNQNKTWFFSQARTD